jgi:methylthioribose-1-phosphate isomerase
MFRDRRIIPGLVSREGDRSMLVDGVRYRSIWQNDEGGVEVIDQRRLPFELVVREIATAAEAARAIREMIVRGAPLIGVTAAYGMYLAARDVVSRQDWRERLRDAAILLKSARPTAINPAWAVDRQLEAIAGCATLDEAVSRTSALATTMADEDAECCRMIGEHGLPLIQEIAARKGGEPVHILTHCNAGWLACVDHGTATSPIYLAHDRGIPIHVWVDETRPRNQGARLTAWELAGHGVPHTVIVDNAGGHLMQHGMVDIVIVGSDRTTATGDVCNKIGTYLKALAARDNDIPFYAALPSSTFDWRLRDGVRDIPIEERDADEVRCIDGVAVMSPESPVANYGFDVTPARLVTGLIPERGICEANEEDIARVVRGQGI